MTAHGFGMYGMWGQAFDPGQNVFSGRVRKELDVNIGASPYNSDDVVKIATAILALPPEVPALVWGTSLGANNAPLVAAYVFAKNPKRLIHGIWGFQASIYGVKAGDAPYYHGITPNVLFAHLTWSRTVFPVPGIGAYRWAPAPNNNTTKLHLDEVDDPHPGDGNAAVQNKYLNEMKDVIAAAEKVA